MATSAAARLRSIDSRNGGNSSRAGRAASTLLPLVLSVLALAILFPIGARLVGWPASDRSPAGARPAAAAHSTAVAPAAASREVNLLALGDWGTGTKQQKEVAAAMAGYVERNGIRLDAVLLLGDNFYGDLKGGVTDPSWKKLFETMYDVRSLDVPFYAVLGNHDYEDDKEKVQLDYARKNPDSR